jgi:hypothetical protein
LEKILTAIIDIGPIIRLGHGPGGERRLVPILGGRFEGPRLRGRVLPGADRQLIPDTVLKTLDALYELETDDGVVLTVRNRVKVDMTAERGIRPASTIDIRAPYGNYGWLNQAVVVGRLEPPTAEHPAVRVDMYEMHA